MALERKEGKLLVPLEGKAAEMDFELVKVKDDVFMLVGKKRDYFKADERIFSIIRKGNLSELVEGTFENSLNKEEQGRLAVLLKEGSVEKFKLSDKYKKAVYRVKPKEGEKQAGVEKTAGPAGQKTEQTARKNSVLGAKGFLVAKNELFVKNLSEKFSEQIKKDELKGIKGFDDVFYIMNKGVYDKGREKVLEFLKGKKGVDSGTLSSELKMEKDLVKGVCEFLKEEGEVMEKRKGLYCFIE